MNEKDLASIIKERESGINANERARYAPTTSTTFGTLMRKVYVWMALALVITGLAAFLQTHLRFLAVAYALCRLSS